MPRTLFFKWSPNSDQLVTFHQYYETKDNPNPGPNVMFWSIPDGEKMGSFLHKSAEGWEPHWTQDSNFIIRKIGEQLLVFSRAEPTKGKLGLLVGPLYRHCGLYQNCNISKLYICDLLQFRYITVSI